MEFLKNIDASLKKSRRRFLIVTTFAAGSLAVISKIWPGRKPLAKTTTFLTRDGKLVEVDLSGIPEKRSLVTKQQLVSWIWKDQKL
jgi:hypothetical protein